MSKHTKGYWTIEPVGVAGNPNHKLIIGHPDPKDFQVIRTIGRLFDHGSSEENKANAKLIAAAPNMKTMIEGNIVYFQNFKKLFSDSNSEPDKEMLSIIDRIIELNECVLAETEIGGGE